jgi:hypothetical protein
MGSGSGAVSSGRYHTLLGEGVKRKTVGVLTYDDASSERHERLSTIPRRLTGTTIGPMPDASQLTACQVDLPSYAAQRIMPLYMHTITQDEGKETAGLLL